MAWNNLQEVKEYYEDKLESISDAIVNKGGPSVDKYEDVEDAISEITSQGAYIYLTSSAYGATLICGSQTYTLQGSELSHAFAINSMGAYTCKATLGRYESVQKTVIVNSYTVYFETLKLQEVPAEYQQVEYLGVPNTGYINTEFYPTQNTELTIKASHDGSTYSSGDLGQIGTCRWTGNPFWSFGIYPRNINSGASTGATTFFYGTYYSSGGHTGYIIINDAVNTTDVFEYNLGLTSVSVKNVTTGSVKSASITRNQTFTSTQPLWVGAFNNQGSRLSVNYGTHIYSASIKENGNTVRYFIPCKRVSDNVLGMWDAINDVFYTNAGTGDFTAGPIITAVA